MARVDDRLIHGQVVVGWVRYYRVDQIIVVDDQIAKDSLRKDLLKMAAPNSGLDILILPIQDTVRVISDGIFEGKKTILLFDSPRKVLELVKCGGKISLLNIGNMRFSDGKRHLFESVFVSEEDIKSFSELHNLGVKLEYQAAPNDPKIDLIERLCL